jgi:hypothetical protein
MADKATGLFGSLIAFGMLAYEAADSHTRLGRPERRCTTIHMDPSRPCSKWTSGETAGTSVRFGAAAEARLGLAAALLRGAVVTLPVLAGITFLLLSCVSLPPGV